MASPVIAERGCLRLGQLAMRQSVWAGVFGAGVQLPAENRASSPPTSKKYAVRHAIN
jgi:hypothetical protein